MKNIIFATGNKDKMREIREIMADCDVQIQSMKEAGIQVDIVEDGKTFEENALIKARAIAAHTDAIVLADDSGLEIDALNKEPGVYSARYMGVQLQLYFQMERNLLQDRPWKAISAGSRKAPTDLVMIRFFIWMSSDVLPQPFLQNRKMQSATEEKLCVR